MIYKIPFKKDVPLQMIRRIAQYQGNDVVCEDGIYYLLVEKKGETMCNTHISKGRNVNKEIGKYMEDIKKSIVKKGIIKQKRGKK
jgi:hypothetical protein